MYICYLCNGLERMSYDCAVCGANMLDGGKIVDYYGDYSPYMEIEDAQMVDGVPNSYGEHQCVHIGVCSACNHMEEIMVKEQTFH
ncbi:hypothetical protein MUN88_11830 [Gracilibacillus caseinilyticus]|uniref:Uncharacterized protein n=1 Tax=Gracilibacillus caseinilyticus TaxID=2932256 RepID=A0ABY4ERS9_9BACI|nr:hypothetical protein [Gracilibacillus caseinilyticus]UOQ46786.1 hypothetical protein MUN88_11830 [Gracilibacillus caseinilyticus]